MQPDSVISLEELEREVIQTAIMAHCKSDDEDAQQQHRAAVSKLIEARYQLVKTS